eukprot:scaffold3002_cov64-Attheya_sp.AAC.5
MYALNCPVWHLQDTLVAPVVLADDEYTVMVCGLLYLAGRFHLETSAFQWIPHPKMVDKIIRLWM